MASRRDTIIQELITQLKTVSGWTVMQRDPGDDPDTSNVKLAVVLDAGETVRQGGFHTLTTKSLALSILVRLRVGDADDTLDGGNADRYLHRAVAELEAAIFAQPEPYTVVEQLLMEGWENVTPQDESRLIAAEIRLNAIYRHDIDDPSSFTAVKVV